MECRASRKSTPGGLPRIYCGAKMKQTNWLPPKGFDPRLREFECPRCHNKQYDRVSGSQIAVEARC